jgi:hypothetical protein
MRQWLAILLAFHVCEGAKTTLTLGSIPVPSATATPTVTPGASATPAPPVGLLAGCPIPFNCSASFAGGAMACSPGCVACTAQGVASSGTRYCVPDYMAIKTLSSKRPCYLVLARPSIVAYYDGVATCPQVAYMSSSKRLLSVSPQCADSVMARAAVVGDPAYTSLMKDVESLIPDKSAPAPTDSAALNTLMGKICTNPSLFKLEDAVKNVQASCAEDIKIYNDPDTQAVPSGKIEDLDDDSKSLGPRARFICKKNAKQEYCGASYFAAQEAFSVAEGGKRRAALQAGPEPSLLPTRTPGTLPRMTPTPTPAKSSALPPLDKKACDNIPKEFRASIEGMGCCFGEAIKASVESIVEKGDTDLANFFPGFYKMCGIGLTTCGASARASFAGKLIVKILNYQSFDKVDRLKVTLARDLAANLAIDVTRVVVTALQPAQKTTRRALQAAATSLEASYEISADDSGEKGLEALKKAITDKTADPAKFDLTNTNDEVISNGGGAVSLTGATTTAIKSIAGKLTFSLLTLVVVVALVVF